MGATFSWIGELVQWFARWIPRLGICRATHGGVKFRRGCHVRPIRPGMYVYWPVTTEIEVIPTARQSVDISPQTLMTKDKATVLVSVVLVYEINDIVKALGKSWNVDDTIREVGGTAVVREVVTRTFADLAKHLVDEIRNELTKKCRTLLRPFGVRVLDARFSDFAECQVIRNVGDGRGVIPLVQE